MATMVPGVGVMEAVKAPLASIAPAAAGSTDQTAPEPQRLVAVRWTVWPTVTMGAAGSILSA